MAQNFFPEGNVALATDDERRSLIKVVDLINDGGFGGGGIALVPDTVDPEGNKTADPGTTYYNKSNATFWVKKTGAGNTGWQQLI